MSGYISSINHIFLDASALIQANVSEAPLHQKALAAIEEYYTAGVELWTSRAALHDFLAIMTQTNKFDAPQSTDTIIKRVEYFENQFRIADDGPHVTKKLLEIVHQFPLAGQSVYQANTIATMQVFGIHHLLTSNGEDYDPYSGLISILPLE